MPIYLQIDGIQGDATQEQHRKWMDIEALHWNVSRNLNTVAGKAANRESTEPTISEVVLTKISDSSTTSLFQQAVSGTQGKTATIHLVSTGSPGETYIEYILTNTLIASYTVDSSGDRPLETLKLNFTKLELKYIPYDDNNRPQSPMIASYDLATTRAG